MNMRSSPVPGGGFGDARSMGWYCPADINGDGVVDVNDLNELIAAWGDKCTPTNPCRADINNDGIVDVKDLLEIIDNWGPCNSPYKSYRLWASDGRPNDYFGQGVAISGNNAVIGAWGANAPCDYPSPDCNPRGAAFTFHFDGSYWQEESKLTSGTDEIGTGFGETVAIHGDVALISSSRDNELAQWSGAAYIFRRDTSQPHPEWIQEAKLIPVNEEHTYDRQFGSMIAIGEGVAFVAAKDYYGQTPFGNIYNYDVKSKSWIEGQRLVPFGCGYWWDNKGSASMSGNLLAVGNGRTNDGSVFIYRFNGKEWIQEQCIQANNGANGDLFGKSISIDGDTLVVGAPGRECNNEITYGDGCCGVWPYECEKYDCCNSSGCLDWCCNACPDNKCGAVYIYNYNGKEWVEVKESLGGNGDRNGSSVSISGEMMVSGSPYYDYQRGYARSFTNIYGDDWVESETPFYNENKFCGDYFGVSVSVDNDRVLIGAWGDGTYDNPDPDLKVGEQTYGPGSATVFHIDNELNGSVGFVKDIKNINLPTNTPPEVKKIINGIVGSVRKSFRNKTIRNKPNRPLKKSNIERQNFWERYSNDT